MKKLLVILMFALLIFSFGCDEEQQDPNDSTKTLEPLDINSFEECAKAGYPVMESYPRQCNTPDGKHFVEEIKLPDAATLDSDLSEEEATEEETGDVEVTEIVIDEDPYCGDGECSTDETCSNCYEDCACKSPAECNKGRCVTPECGSEGDCDDEDTCTVNKCYFAGNINAYCGFEPIKRCKNGDDCCPRDCNADTDSDCDPVCGNEVCETGEDDDECPEDCTYCGNDECEDGENVETCSEDCDIECGDDICSEGERGECLDDCPAECGNGFCEPGEDIKTCTVDCDVEV